MTVAPIYRLAALFNMRERTKKDAEEAHAKAQKNLATEKTTLKEMEETLVKMKQSREQKRQEFADAMRSGDLTIEKIQINNRHIDMLIQKEKDQVVLIEKQKEAVTAAQKLVDEALQKMLDATQEFKVLEKHREKWLKETMDARAKKEEDEVGDITQAQYFARKEKGDL